MKTALLFVLMMTAQLAFAHADHGMPHIHDGAIVVELGPLFMLAGILGIVGFARAIFRRR